MSDIETGYVWDHVLGRCDICNRAGLKHLRSLVCPCGCGKHIEGHYIGDIGAVHRAQFEKWDKERKARP